MKRLLLLLAAVVFGGAAAPPSKTVHGIRFGPQVTVSGLWFTNFENSRFLECSPDRCREDRPQGEWASISCGVGACERLDREARAIAHGPEGRPPEGAFLIRFVGRRGLAPHRARYLGDGGRDILLERLVEIRKAKDD